MSSSNARTLLLGIVAGSLLVARSAGAQNFSDATLSDWHSTVIAGGCSGSSSPQATGGNPGAYLAIQQFTCDYVGVAHLSSFSWNPSTQGAITKFGVGYQDSGTSDIAFLTVIRQAGNYFVSSDYNIGTGNVWTMFSNPDETLYSYDVISHPTGWCNITPGFGLGGVYVCGPASIDFSSTGTQIDFGVESANSGGYYGTVGGIDNFYVDLEVDAPLDQPVDATPEPASLVLLATGLLGVVAAARRRTGNRK